MSILQIKMLSVLKDYSGLIGVFIGLCLGLLNPYYKNISDSIYKKKNLKRRIYRLKKFVDESVVSFQFRKESVIRMLSHPDIEKPDAERVQLKIAKRYIDQIRQAIILYSEKFQVDILDSLSPDNIFDHSYFLFAINEREASESSDVLIFYDEVISDLEYISTTLSYHLK